MKVMLERGQTPLRKYLRTLLKMNQVSILRGFIKFMIMMIYLGADVDQNDLVNFNYFTSSYTRATLLKSCRLDMIRFYQSEVQAVRPH